MKAWLFQDHRQKQRMGDSCPWSVGWIDPEGKRKSKRIGCRSNAEKYQRRLEGQLASGTYCNVSRANWQQFKDEFEAKVLAGMKPGTREGMQFSINHFERIVAPAKPAAITTRTIAQYVAVRRQERLKVSKRKRANDVVGKQVSVATVNKELRCIRAMCRKGFKWGYLPAVPEFEFLREPGKLATYIAPEDFTAIYQACDVAALPEGQGYSAADWWRAVLVFAYMTGWRIGAILALRWEDVDLEAGTALSHAEDNKGNRDQLVPIHPLIVEHLRRLRSFGSLVFAWPKEKRRLYDQYEAIQQAAGVKPAGKRRYGFHDLRRAFATMNAATLSAEALQALMQHRDYQTTRRYINMARQLNPALEKLYVPTLKVAGA